MSFLTEFCAIVDRGCKDTAPAALPECAGHVRCFPVAQAFRPAWD